MNTRVRATITGRVQGVGFRPAVYRFATQFGLGGFVCNDRQGVTVEVEGDEAQVGAFFHQLTQRPPSHAVIAKIENHVLPLKGYRNFAVVESVAQGETSVHIPPDLATCDDCLRELLDPQDRRFEYPFINCTNCGPRFTIIRDLPYDRDKTSMADFKMCEPCDHEYHDTDDRRFHAQPDACAQCGPQLTFKMSDGGGLADAPLAKARAILQRGHIVAIKSLGGFHLACDALSAEAVGRLRRKKNRPHKPLAVMFRDIAVLKQYCRVNEAEEAELLSTARPIVVVAARAVRDGERLQIPPVISPDTQTLGVFLPYTPLHHLLMRDFEALVMTSGNVTDEPIVSDDSELPAILGPIADAALTHNRPIVHKCDDSVLAVVRGQRQFLRRARGFVPGPVRIADHSPQILAFGAELKSTFCFVNDGDAFVSQHMGDLKDFRTYDYFLKEIGAWQLLMKIMPDGLAHDLHPDYLSTKLAEKFPVALKIGVQHHHAHIVSVMAEHNLHEPILGIALDGTGFGTDGTIWGGEILVADRSDFERLAHFKTYPLPGGDKAVAEPWRMAVSVLANEDLAEWANRKFAPRKPEMIQQMTAAGFNSPLTSSAGRLFDAVAAMLGLCDETTYEAQAAIRLEAVADAQVTEQYPFEIETAERPWVISFGAMVRAIVEDRQAGAGVGTIAAKFHNTVAAAVVRVCRYARGQRNLSAVALSGGVFQNQLLLQRILDSLQNQNFKVYANHAVPANDGGVSLGQATVAVERMRRGCV